MWWSVSVSKRWHFYSICVGSSLWLGELKVDRMLNNKWYPKL